MTEEQKKLIERALLEWDEVHGAVMQLYRLGPDLQKLLGIPYLPAPVSKAINGLRAVNDLRGALLSLKKSAEKVSDG